MNAILLCPFLEAARDYGCSDNELAERLGVPLSAVDDPALMIPANVVYAFLAWITDRIGRTDICARIGQRMTQGNWAPILPLLSGSHTVWEFLLRFTATAEDSGGAVGYRLEVEGKIATWRLTRPTSATSNACYADAVAAGFFTETIRQAADREWDTGSVVAVTSDSTLIPDDILPATSVIPGAIGFCLRFPSAYLLCEMPPVEPFTEIPDTGLPEAGTFDLRDRTRQIIELHIAHRGFGINEIATSLGISRWKLQFLLKSSGITIAELRTDVRRELAIEFLASGDQAISTIAADLGYTSGSNFARAFRSWTGMTPGEYQKQL